jgi:hypothetical protein
VIKITILAAMLLALAGCVIPFGTSTGTGDDRSPYFSNEGALNATSGSEQIHSEQDEGVN